MQAALYCDASVHSDLPGYPGGWAWVAWRDGERVANDSGHVDGLAINLAELFAIAQGAMWVQENIRGLKRLLIYSDNQMAVDMLTRGGKLKGSNAPQRAMARGIARAILNAVDGVEVEFRKITRAQNKLADAMACAASCLNRQDPEPVQPAVNPP